MPCDIVARFLLAREEGVLFPSANRCRGRTGRNEKETFNGKETKWRKMETKSQGVRKEDRQNRRTGQPNVLSGCELRLYEMLDSRSSIDPGFLSGSRC